jgi:hypothetical protein
VGARRTSGILAKALTGRLETRPKKPFQTRRPESGRNPEAQCRVTLSCKELPAPGGNKATANGTL